MMAFDSLHAFWVMEGHGPYVWTCYVVFFVLTVAMAWWSVRERRQIIRQQYREQTLAQQETTDAASRPASAGFQRIHPS